MAKGQQRSNKEAKKPKKDKPKTVTPPRVLKIAEKKK
jgi:hypothetical protein